MYPARYPDRSGIISGGVSYFEGIRKKETGVRVRTEGGETENTSSETRVAGTVTKIFFKEVVSEFVVDGIIGDTVKLRSSAR